MEKTIQVDTAPMVTIWVHGTKGTARMLPLKAVQHFFECLPGLNHYTLLAPEYHHRKMAEMLNKEDPAQFPLEHFYLFGWEGILSFQEREKAAHDLHHQIIELIEHYRLTYGSAPCLRIITHSHGGNVVLNLARLNNDHTYTIDELVLLACPVQIATATLAQEKMFKAIVHLFSKADIFQIIDMQGLYRNMDKAPLFSQRRFFSADNMVQISLKKGCRPLAHVEFLLARFLQALPTILTRARLLYKDASQLHQMHDMDIKK